MAVVNFLFRMRLRISRTEAKERVSTSHISVASSLLSTNAFQRECVSQTISALGKDSRSAATAGKVWTRSPREPKRTTRKRCSVMRCLADCVEKVPRRMIFRITHNGYANAKPRSSSTLRNRLRRIVCAFRMDIWPQLFEQSFHAGFGKQNNVIDRTKGGNQKSACIFIEHGPARPLQSAHTGIVVDSDNENVALAPRAFKIADVADVQSIEAAVREDDAFAALLVFRKLVLQRFARNDLAASFTHNSGSSP